MEAKCAVWLSERVAPATRAMDTLLKSFGGCEAVYGAGKNDYLAAGVANEKTLKALLDKELKSADDTIARCERLGIRVIPYASEEYPDRLANIYAPPALLYAQGEPLDADSRPLISIVGTRDCTEYGRKSAYVIAGKLAARGFCVVSGLAIGIDAAALAGAVRADGSTVGVLGCGLAKNYPAENFGLRRAMLKKGTVISEYAPTSRISKGNFPLRNRIMAGISVGTLIVEAPENSGALITANYALEYGRDVFAVPGNINSYESVGSNRLIKDGAVPVTDVEDIVREYVQLFPQIAHKPEKKQAPTRADDAELNEREKLLLSALTAEPAPLEELLAKTGLSVQEALAALSMLEIKGRCKSLPMKKFSLL